jgi:hypothetical protein
MLVGVLIGKNLPELAERLLPSFFFLKGLGLKYTYIKAKKERRRKNK